MYQWQDVSVYQTTEELPAFPAVRRVRKRGRAGKKLSYIDVTATFDIETTNTKDDGFIWSYMFTIGGINFHCRTYSGFQAFIQFLVEQFHVTPNNRLVLYVHNLGYELYYLIQLLNRDIGVDKSLYVSSTKALTCVLSNGIEFRDSLRLFQKSLEGATKGCKHPKQVGDLDYSVYRDADTPITYEEFGYIICDTLGLYEAIERLKMENGYNAATIPLTNTSRVLRHVCNACEYSNGWQQLKRTLAMPRDCLQLAYDAMAGGDTHGNRYLTGKTITNCNSYDFKSAHPSQMLTKKYPMGEPLFYGEATAEELDEIIDQGYGWIGHIGAVGVQCLARNPDPTISISKCIETRPPVRLDNGRVLAADLVYLPMDSNDWHRFREGYTVDGVLACDVWIFKLAPLPEVFRRQIIEWFFKKENEEKDTPDYVFSKICINTIFGACAQKVIRDEYTIDYDTMDARETKWREKLAGLTDTQIQAKQSEPGKLPFLWGLWTASCSRLELWKLIKLVGWERVIYWDTDSVKYRGQRSHAVTAYNLRQMRTVHAVGAEVSNRSGGVSYIGIAEDEAPGIEYGYTEFRALHAKCYAYRHPGEPAESVIAGCSKAAGAKALEDNIYNLRDGLVISPAGGQKLWYMPRPIMGDDETPHTSFIYMEPREITIGALNTGEIFAGDIISC